MPARQNLTTPVAGLEVLALGAADIAACAALSAEAGWNQIERDWALMLAIGRGIGLREGGAGGRLVASAVALPYDPPDDRTSRGVGFVSMVLVTPSWQRRGLATWLTERCTDELDAAGRMPVLDATPTGQGVYRKLGFADGIALGRWRSERPAVAHVPVPAGIALHPVTETAALVARDAGAFGAARARVLADLRARRPELAWAAWRGPGEDKALAGFVLGRDGRAATHVGPVVADDAAIAAALLAHALGRIAGPAIVDLLRGRESLAAMLADTGFAPVRAFTRMHRGDAPPTAANLFVAIGPEFG